MSSHLILSLTVWNICCYCVHFMPIKTSFENLSDLSKFAGWVAILKNIRVTMVGWYYDGHGSIAAVNKLCKHTFITLQFCGSQVQYRSNWNKIKVSGGCVPFWRPREECFLLINVIGRIPCGCRIKVHRFYWLSAEVRFQPFISLFKSSKGKSTSSSAAFLWHTLLPFSSTFKDLCDWIRPTWIT